METYINLNIEKGVIHRIIFINHLKYNNLPTYTGNNIETIINIFNINLIEIIDRNSGQSIRNIEGRKLEVIQFLN